MQKTDRLSTLHPLEQSKVIQRVHQKMLLSFGNQFQAKWAGLDMAMVYDEWAQTLRDCSIGAIAFATEESKKNDMPPSLGAFLKLCRDYKPEPILKLEHKLTVEQIERNKARLAEILANFRHSKNMVAA